MDRPALLTVALLVFTFPTSACLAQELPATAVAAKDVADSPISEIHKVEEHLVSAFNAGKAAEVAGLFAEEGEWIDDDGNAHQGRKNIEAVLTKYFEKYPGAEISLEIEAVRLLGPLAIEEGVRTMSAGSDSRALIRYVAVLAKTSSGWQLASVQDTQQETIPTAQAALQPLEWLVGDWVNEAEDGKVQISYRWDDNKNFLIGEYHIFSNSEEVMTSTHRIGFDPIHARIRSWLFDSDGGFGEGSWTQLGDSWHIHSVATMPDGLMGSAIVTLTPHDANQRFSMRGTDRLVGGVQEDDFELKVVRKAPAAETQK